MELSKMKTQMAVLFWSLLTFCIPELQETAPQVSSENVTAQKTIVGCITQRAGRYLLVNKKRPEGVGIRMSQDLKPHVGLQAKVTGVVEYGPTVNHAKNDKLARDKASKQDPVAVELPKRSFPTGTLC
jgi:hypothetical protein